MKIANVALLLLATTAPPIAEADDTLKSIFQFLGSESSINRHNSAHNGVRRRLEDFMEQAADGKATDELATLEENGDATDVSIVDNVDTAEEEDMDLEEDEMYIEEELVDEEGYTEEDLLLERRKFVSYTPSPWEQQWVDQIDDIMSKRDLCATLVEVEAQKAKLYDYLNMMCVTAVGSYCFYTDHASHYLWYNRENETDFELYVDYTPEFLRDQDRPPAEGIVIEPEDDFGGHPLASKFTYHDDFTEEDYDEFLEPLISHLRFPLAECLADQPTYLADFAGFVVPPKYLDRTDGRVILYDVGSSDWSRLQYITAQWKLQSIDFDVIASYAPTGANEATDVFAQTVPMEYAPRVYRHYFALTDQEQPDGLSNPDNPAAFFLPSKIMNQTVVNDYVIVKLDRGVPAAYKDAILDYILSSPNDIHIDELLVEINPSDMYVLQTYYDENLQLEDLSSKSMGDVYRTMSALRAKGIRAHAWI